MIIYRRAKNKLSVIVSTTIDINFWGIPLAIRCINLRNINVKIIQLWFLCFGVEFEWFHYE